MINFPETPALNLEHTEGGKTWKFNGTAWVGVGSTTVSWDRVSGKPAFGTAAYTESTSYASSAQGAKADSASQPGHLHIIADINGLQAALDAASGEVSTINDLDELFNSARATYYHEVGYTAGGDVSAIEVYATSAKATHLYSRAFTYNASGNIAQVLTTDRQNSGVSLTKNLTYSAGGDLATITRTYSL